MRRGWVNEETMQSFVNKCVLEAITLYNDALLTSQELRRIMKALKPYGSAATDQFNTRTARLMSELRMGNRMVQERLDAIKLEEGKLT